MHPFFENKDLLRLTLIKIPYGNIRQVCLVNKNFYAIYKSKWFWKLKTQLDWNIQEEICPTSWKKLYQEYLEEAMCEIHDMVFEKRHPHADKKSLKHTLKVVGIDGISTRKIPLLIHAASWGKKGLTKTLLECGANVNIKDKYGDTPLHSAVKQKDVYCHVHFEITKMLLEAKADPNVVDGEGKTPLYYAISSQSSTGIDSASLELEKIISTLLEADIDH